MPFELEKQNRLHETGWNSAAVMTSVSSSMLTGLMSRMLNDWSEMLRFQRLILRSSALMYVSPSLLIEIELMWYACAFAYTLRGTAATIVSWYVILGSLRYGIGCPVEGSIEVVNDDEAPPDGPENGDDGSPGTDWSSGGGEGGGALVAAAEPLFSATTLSDFSKTFHNLIVLSVFLTRTLISIAHRTDTRSAGRRVSVVGLTIGRQEEVGSVLAFAPADLVDLFLNLERFEVIELWLVRLELCVELVLAPFLGLVALEQDDAATLVARREVVSRVVKLDRR